MKISLTKQSVLEIQADVVVVGISGTQSLEGAAAELDKATGGAIGRLIDSGEFTGKIFSSATLCPGENVVAPIVFLVGMEVSGTSPGPIRISSQVAGYAAKQLAKRQRRTVAFFLPTPSMPDAICGAMVGCTGQDLFRKEKNLFPFEELIFSGCDQAQLEQGRILGQATNLTRHLVNLPAADLYPESFVTLVQEALEGLPLEFEVWDESKLQEEKCGAIIAVGQGSDRPPRLMMIHYRGATPSDPVLGLVGKGVTFDSGGLSLKPSDGMLDMKCDMTGAATVVGALQAIAGMKLPVNVSAYCGLAENMVSGNSFKLGDVIRTRSGVTVEVHNTDAEGRLVLADTLDVAVSQGVGNIIDFATLTGACMVALGRQVAGLMCNEQKWCGKVLKSADTAGDLAWQLPMFSLYNEQISSNVADIKNVGDGRWGGAITAAKFLERFVGDVPWVHVDIAGPSFADRASNWVDAGASGCFVRTLTVLAENFDSADADAPTV